MNKEIMYSSQRKGEGKEKEKNFYFCKIIVGPLCWMWPSTIAIQIGGVDGGALNYAQS